VVRVQGILRKKVLIIRRNTAKVVAVRELANESSVRRF
jgi:hypothetical protein